MLHRSLLNEACVYCVSIALCVWSCSRRTRRRRSHCTIIPWDLDEKHFHWIMIHFTSTSLVKW